MKEMVVIAGAWLGIRWGWGGEEETCVEARDTPGESEQAQIKVPWETERRRWFDGHHSDRFGS